MNVVPPFEDGVLKWPKDIENDLLDVVDRLCNHHELTLLRFHSLDVVRVIIPNQLGCLLNCCQLRNN
jgi:hypothetical protein